MANNTITLGSWLIHFLFQDERLGNNVAISLSADSEMSDLGPVCVSSDNKCKSAAIAKFLYRFVLKRYFVFILKPHKGPRRCLGFEIIEWEP